MGTVECRHSRIIETGLALISTISAPNTCFSPCYLLINRMPTKALEFSTPFEKLNWYQSWVGFCVAQFASRFVGRSEFVSLDL